MTINLLAVATQQSQGIMQHVFMYGYFSSELLVLTALMKLASKSRADSVILEKLSLIFNTYFTQSKLVLLIIHTIVQEIICLHVLTSPARKFVDDILCQSTAALFSRVGGETKLHKIM
jgi:hypothetical protein